MAKPTLYCVRTDEMYEDTDILVQYYNDEKFRTVLLSKQEFATLQPWKMCSLLNSAYDRGYDEAMADLRRLIGADK